MRRVFKYQIPWDDYSTQPAHVYVERFLSVGVQDDTLCAWVLVDDNPDHQPRHMLFRVAGTGHNLDSGSYTPTDHYIGTVHYEGLVFHIFGTITLFESQAGGEA